MIGTRASVVSQSWAGSSGGGPLHESTGHESAQSGRESSQNRKGGGASHVDKIPQGERRVGPREGQEEAPGVAEIPEFEKTDSRRSRQRGEWESAESRDRESRVFRVRLTAGLTCERPRGIRPGQWFWCAGRGSGPLRRCAGGLFQPPVEGSTWASRGFLGDLSSMEKLSYSSNFLLARAF